MDLRSCQILGNDFNLRIASINCKDRCKPPNNILARCDRAEAARRVDLANRATLLLTENKELLLNYFAIERVSPRRTQNLITRDHTIKIVRLHEHG